jgi:hypothetical protein
MSTFDLGDAYSYGTGILTYYGVQYYTAVPTGTAVRTSRRAV